MIMCRIEVDARRLPISHLYATAAFLFLAVAVNSLSAANDTMKLYLTGQLDGGIYAPVVVTKESTAKGDPAIIATRTAAIEFQSAPRE